MKKTIIDRIFKREDFSNIEKGQDTSAVSFFYRPYYKPESIPENNQFDDSAYWGHDVDIINCSIDGRGCAEGLKISFGYNILVENCEIYGGYEDCVDIVRGANITFKNCKFIACNTKHHFTIKGGCKNILIEDCEFVNDFNKWYDGAILDIGNYCNYDQVQRPKAREVKVKNCKLTNIKFKLLSRVLYGSKPKVENTKGLTFKLPSIFTKIFFKLRNSGKLGSVTKISEEDKIVYDIEK